MALFGTRKTPPCAHWQVRNAAVEMSGYLTANYVDL